MAQEGAPYSEHLLHSRKFLASLVLGLHVTPGRRLQATFKKFQRSTEFTNPPDGLVKPLLDLLEDTGWSNSVEDLGTFIGAPKDNEESFVKITTERLLSAIVNKLLECNNFKVKDMARRHEIDLETTTTISGNCSHDASTVSSMRVFSFFVDGLRADTITFAEFQCDLDNMMSSTSKEDCRKCGRSLLKTVKSAGKEFSDPDFLAVAFAQPVCFEGGQGIVRFGISVYLLKVVVHWDSSKALGSVSREKEDGWHWHGVDDSQGQDFEYSADQMRSYAHLRNVAVMMMVRVDATSVEQNSEQQEVESNAEVSNEDRVEQGEYTDHQCHVEEAKDQGDGGGDIRMTDESPTHPGQGECILCMFCFANIQKVKMSANFVFQLKKYAEKST